MRRTRERHLDEPERGSRIESAPALAVDAAAALLALQRHAGNRAVARALAASPRRRVPTADELRSAVASAAGETRLPLGQAAHPVLHRALMSRNQFLGQRAATTTVRTLTATDATLHAIAGELQRYATPPPGTALLTVAQTLSALCKQWLAAHPYAWVPPAGHAPAPGGWTGATRSTTASPVVRNAVRTVIERLHQDVQQELLELSSQAAGGTMTVFKEQTRPQGPGQTPPAAMQVGVSPRDPGGQPHQQHWEGWKIHVSVPDSVAGDVAARLVPQLEAEGSWYKVRKRIDEYRKATDASAGKFIVIYPRSVRHLEQVLTWLEATLPGLVGTRPSPPVHGDVQLDAGGHVWARYGVFLDTVHARSPERWVKLREGGTYEANYAVWDPVQGGWVKDPRDAPIPPAWANQLLSQLRAIRSDRAMLQQFTELEHTAEEAKSRPRARSVI